MNLPTVLVLLGLLALYGLAVRSICKQGPCADCGVRGICPVHTLGKDKIKRPNAAALAQARRLAAGSDQPPLIVSVKEK
ncbi:MAG: hypothetical protein ABF651_05055 [Sporolactobacillus sp.]